jgi:hypothetical protein
MASYGKRDLSASRLAALADAADTPARLRAVADLYRRRADMLKTQAERHDRLQQLYAAAPKSLLAKRAHGWNTPGRQRELAEKARRGAEAARKLADASSGAKEK